jgi:IS30 family transposase
MRTKSWTEEVRDWGSACTAGRTSSWPWRGSEFAAASELQEALGAPVYFCLPHRPWQRGTNENTNGPLGEYLPKGTDLSAVSDEEVRKAYDGLNRRPRKRYGWRCPWEVYHGEALHLL